MGRHERKEPWPSDDTNGSDRTETNVPGRPGRHRKLHPGMLGVEELRHRLATESTARRWQLDAGY